MFHVRIGTARQRLQSLVEYFANTPDEMGGSTVVRDQCAVRFGSPSAAGMLCSSMIITERRRSRGVHRSIEVSLLDLVGPAAVMAILDRLALHVFEFPTMYVEILATRQRYEFPSVVTTLQGVTTQVGDMHCCHRLELLAHAMTPIR